MNSKFCEIFVETLKINSGSCGESIWTKRYYSWPWWSVFQPSTSSSDKFQNSSFGWINNMINYESGLVYENQPIINISWDVRRVKEDSFVWYYSFQPFKKNPAVVAWWLSAPFLIQVGSHSATVVSNPQEGLSIVWTWKSLLLIHNKARCRANAYIHVLTIIS